MSTGGTVPVHLGQLTSEIVAGLDGALWFSGSESSSVAKIATRV